MLAEQLEHELCEQFPLPRADVYSDLLAAALDEVNWFEIARNLLTDCFPVAAAESTTPPPQPVGPKFEPGKIAGTPAALAAVSHDDIAAALDRHLRGDWGFVCPADSRENARALEVGGRLFSVYEAANQTRFWLITEADRSVTTVLLPSDY
ncbi:MAG: hypothetical protein SGJ19_06800 [Planctomycetia bacterium]|nr:hypothetical protein [Planctomycetia bacterium]